MTETRPGRGSDQFILRFPEGMRDKVKIAAEKNGRSMNAEIVARLDASFDQTKDTEILKEIQSLREEMSRLFPLGFADKDGRFTSNLVSAYAKAGNHLARHEREPTDEEIAEDEARQEKENSLPNDSDWMGEIEDNDTVETPPKNPSNKWK